MKKYFICLVAFIFLTGLTYAEKFKLQLRYDNFSRDMELVESAMVLKDWNNEYWSQMELISLKSNEQSKRLYLESSWQVIPQLKLNALIGLGKINSEIIDPEFIRSAGYGTTYTWEGESFKEDSVKGQSEIGFLYGLGGELTFYKRNALETKLTAQYIFQEDLSNEIILSKLDTYSLGGSSAQAIFQKSEIQKIRSKEVEIALALSKKLNKLVFSGGPIFYWSSSSYIGKGFTEVHSVNYGFGGFNHYHRTKIIDFEFLAKNKKWLGGFGKIEYGLTDKARIFTQIMIGSKEGLVTGLTLNF